jgi:hypothetical protein
MVKNAISDYSSTAASNTDVGGVNIDEGMSPSGVNNAIRELMSHLADLNAGTSSLGTIKVDNLQLDGNAITSTDTNGNISLTPNGTGSVVLDGINYPQADGTADYLLKTDGAGQLSFAQVDTASIAADAIDGTKIADDAVDSEHIVDNAVGAAALNVTGNGTAGQFLSSDGDGTMTWADAGGGFDLGTALTGTTPTIDWSSATAFSHTLTGDTTYSFSNVPSGGEIELFLKNIGNSWDFSKLSDYTNVTDGTQIDFSSQFTGTTLRSAFFNQDGSKFYMIDSDDDFFQYSLSTAWDLTTKTYDNKTFSPFYSGSYISDMPFNNDGTLIVKAGGVNVGTYALSTAYDISTFNSSVVDEVNFTSLFNTSGSSTSNPDLHGAKFISSGTELLVYGQKHLNSGTNACPTIIKVSLSTAYDLGSTITHVQDGDLNVGTTFGGSISLYHVNISNDGKHITCVPDAGASLFHWTMTTAFDLSTITYDGEYDFPNVTSGYNYNALGPLIPSPNGLYFYSSETNGSNRDSTTQSIYRFDIGSVYAANFPATTSTLPETFGQGADPATTSYLRMVSLDGTNVLITDHREIN